MRSKLPCFFLGTATIIILATGASAADKDAAPNKTGRAWTTDEAIAQLALYPDDAYLQYVALQLARRDGDAQLKRVVGQIQSLSPNAGRRDPAGRRSQINLFSLTTGALAVQESLQLDAMAGEQALADAGRDPRMRGPRAGAFTGTPMESNNMRQIAIAMHNYHDANGHFPPAASYDDNGKPLLSWRVLLLPYIEGAQLYDTFHLDEPWDSPHNQALIARMPDFYKSPRDRQGNQTKTRIVAPVGDETIFPKDKPIALRHIQDGTSNTILFLQVPAKDAVVWTQPDDLPIDAKKPAGGLGGGAAGWIHAALADGSVRSIPNTAEPRLINHLLTRAGGEVIDWEAIHRRPPAASPGEREPAEIQITSLEGPTIQSHPFEEMLGGAMPEVSSLAAATPEDFYYIRFRSLAKLLELADSADLWATHLFSHAAQTARTHQTVDRLKTQLCVETNNLLRPFYDMVVSEVAIVGSDLFLREGSDVTLLFHFDKEPVFKSRMDGFLESAEKAHADAKRVSGDYRGIAITFVGTPDRTVHVYSAYPKPGLHIRSNSIAAMKRVLDTLLDEATNQSLAATHEFQYMRTLYKKDSDLENGFVYLSDPFIRNLVGPVKKITERRRMVCYNHLRMLGHASMLYRTELGAAPTSIEQLIKTKCLPDDFGHGEMTCPDGGTYALSSDGAEGVCSHHGRAGRMTPCCEIPVETITATEQQLYGEFLDEYNNYWRTFFDPIGIRVQTTPESYRLETIVLPLIDNTIYSTMVQVLGGAPVALDTAPTPDRTIFSMGFKVDKSKFIATDGELAAHRLADLNRMKQIGLAFHNYASVHNRFPPHDAKGAGLSWRVHLLPYLEEATLYERFKLDEPWDSPNNKPLLDEMPAIYGESGTATRIMGFSGDGAPFGSSRGLQFKDIRDGMSNTILVVEAGPDKAVPWTKPIDAPFDKANPIAALGDISENGFAVAMMDGYVRVLPRDIDANTLAASITCDGGETVSLDREPPRRAERRQRPMLDANQLGGMFRELGATDDEINGLNIGEFLAKGVGDNIGFHVYDAEPTVSFSISQAAGNLMGGWGPGFSDGFLVFLPLLSSLNSPVYLTIPVTDAGVVDRFLERLDPIIARGVRRPFGGGFFSVKVDYYQLPSQDDSARCFVWEFFGFRFRFFVARVNETLVIATQPDVIRDFIELAAKGDGAKNTTVDKDEVAHMLVRVRPENWKRVLADYRLGWAESNREACVKNLGPLTGFARAFGGSAEDALAHARSLRGVQYFCPGGGEYMVTTDETGAPACACSLHGTALSPTQSIAPGDGGAMDRLLDDFKGLSAALTVTEEGLRAVLRVDRKGNR